VVEQRVVHQPIKVGLKGAIYSEVLEGLNPGDITLRDRASISVNQRVRPKFLTLKP
jgi:hypothetical protein